jgi:hypothetical protein
MLSVICSACSVSVPDETVTTNNQEQVAADVKNSDLSDADKSEFAAAVTRSASGDYQIYGKSVHTVIGEQRAFDVAAAAAASKAAKLRLANEAALNNDLLIEPISVHVERGSFGSGTFIMDAPYKDIDDITFQITNRGRKAIHAFASDALMTDKGGGQIFSGNLGDAAVLQPGSTVKIVVRHKPDAVYDEQVNARNVADADLLLHYTVTHIWYVDGTDISR